MRYLIVIAIICHLPIWGNSQSVREDSVVIPSGNSYIRYTQPTYYVIPSANDSIITYNTSTKKRALTPKSSLPISTATQTAIDLKLNIADTSGMFTAYRNAINGKQPSLGFTPYNATNPSGYISANQTITISGDISGSGTTGIATTIGNGKVTDAMLAGSISNAKLSNNTVTIGNTSIALGATSTTLAGLSSVTSTTFVGALTGTASGNLVSGGNAGTPSAIVLTNATGTAAGLTAGNVSTNANLSGDISSVGNVTTIGATKVTNAMLAGSIAYSKLSLTGAILNADLAGSIDLTTKVTGILPFANNAGATAATSATTGAMTVNMTTTIITITPSGACTFNGSGGVTGQRATFFITTSGVSSFVLTWGTNFKTTGTLATGTTTAKIFAVSFLCTNGTQWIETARTIAQ